MRSAANEGFADVAGTAEEAMLFAHPGCLLTRRQR